MDGSIPKIGTLRFTPAVELTQRCLTMVIMEVCMMYCLLCATWCTSAALAAWVTGRGPAVHTLPLTVPRACSLVGCTVSHCIPHWLNTLVHGDVCRSAALTHGPTCTVSTCLVVVDNRRSSVGVVGVCSVTVCVCLSCAGGPWHWCAAL